MIISDEPVEEVKSGVRPEAQPGAADPGPPKASNGASQVSSNVILKLNLLLVERTTNVVDVETIRTSELYSCFSHGF